jgi:TrmH family RNA methyltransferase
VRKLTDARQRRSTGRFLAEGAQSVREALARRGTVDELFVTPAAADRYAALIHTAGVPVTEISSAAAKSLSETVSPQGLIAVCRRIDVSLDSAFSAYPRLVAGLVEPNDPGNAGTILRTADAAGADAVVITGGGVDVYNGKSVRATAGSLFHLDVVLGSSPADLIAAATTNGIQVLATSGTGETDLDALIDAGALRQPTLWLFGNEARGLDDQSMASADVRVRVPIYGAAESLNLAAAGAICLYASARAQR